MTFKRENDYIMAWEHYLSYLLFVRVNHRSPVNSPYNGSAKQRRFWWFLYCLPEEDVEQTQWHETSRRSDISPMSKGYAHRCCRGEKLTLNRNFVSFFILHAAVVSSCWMVGAGGDTVGPGPGGAAVICDLASCVWKWDTHNIKMDIL